MALTKVSRGLLSTGIVDNSNATAITIDSSENVGIGSSPSNLLHLHNTSGDSFIRMSGGGSLGINYGGFVNGYGVAGTGGYLDLGVIDANAFRTAIQIRQQAAEIIFKNGDTERMRLSGGILSVGTTDNAPGAGNTNAGVAIRGGSDNRSFFSVNGDYVMHLNRNTNDGSVLEFSKNGTNVGSISTNANSLPSDRNFKKNIKNLSLGLNFISSLEPVTYNYKIDDDGAPIMSGLIAQDVETALTAEGVEANSMTLLQHNPTEDVKESNYQMDYLKLVPVLINAVKELTERLEQLENN